MEERKKKFLRCVERTSGRHVRDLSECWLWDGTKHRDGYGWTQTNYSKESGCIYAHQLSYHLFKDSTYRPSREKPLRHLCEAQDNHGHRACVNPEHLVVGTIVENIADRDENLGKYQLKGEDVGTAKFSLEEARKVQQKHLDGKEYKDIAAEYSVSRRTIERICTGAHYGLPDCRPLLVAKREEKNKNILALIAEGNSYSQITRVTGASAGYISTLRKKAPNQTSETCNVIKNSDGESRDE